MKQYIYLLLTLGIFFFNSCTDETMGKDKIEVEEGIPVKVSLSFTRADIAEVTTRSTVDNENAVYDVRIFIFDQHKDLEYTDIFRYEDGNTNKLGTVSIPKGKVTTGQKYIYAIANTEDGAGIFLDELENIEKVGDLNTLVSELNEETDQRLGGHLLMSGAYLEKSTDENYEIGSCTILKGMDGKILEGKIELSHVNSRITFNVGVKENSNITFVPKTWRIVNVPKQCYVFPSVSDWVTSYFDTAEKSFDNSTIVDTKYKGGTFSFYMYENRTEAKGDIKDYNDRERREKNDAGLNGAFKYADPNATYVVLTGDYSDGDKTSASVQYTIHLGFVDDEPSDFSSLRNTIYTYNVKVVGVNNIILEVESSQPGEEFKEKQPGAEGSVVVAEQSISVDSHYEARNVVFRKNDLSNLSVIVSTVFNEEGKYSIDAETGKVTSTNFTDYEWVKFVRRTASTGLAEYPGDSEAVSTNGSEVPLDDDGEHYLTIDQVLQQLYAKKNENDNKYWKGSNESVTYTAFIDEFYYDGRDWREFVNVDNRKMHILCNTKFSNDKQSDLTTANIMISQRSIKTIYNKNDYSYQTAWGVETTDETKGMPMYKNTIRTGNNGRYNTFQILEKDLNIGSSEWKGCIDWTSQDDNKLKSKGGNWQYANYACLQRNRDLDGNGKIDANEIRWYLPSTTQYTGLWLGKDALYPEARLFQKNPADITENGSTENSRVNNHFISSNGVRFWAEEGAATGNTAFDVQTTNFNFRCARNLEKKGAAPYKSPEESDNINDYVQCKIDKNGLVTEIDLTRIDPFALRRTKETSLSDGPEHTGADLNRPYKKFEVIAATNNKCPKGYRKPNQRELSLIAGYSTKDIGKTVSCTYSNLSYKTNKYYYAFWRKDDKSNIVSLEGSKNGAVTRCVKDID